METATAFAIPLLPNGEVGDGAIGYFSFPRRKTAGGAPNKMSDVPFESPPSSEEMLGGAEFNG